MRSIRLPAIVCSIAMIGAWIAASGQTKAGSGPDAEAAIYGLEVEIADQQLLASFQLGNAFDQDFRRRIDSGLPTELIYRFELARARRSWFDKSVATGSLQVVAMYNAVTDEYLVNYKHDGRLIESRVVRDVDELRSVMTQFDGFPVFSLDLRSSQERLQLRVRAELGTRTYLALIPHTLNTEWAASKQFSIPG